MYNFKIVVIFIVASISFKSFAVDPFAQKGGTFSVSMSKLQETDDITLVARDRSSPEITLKTSKSSSVKAAFKIFGGLFIYGEQASSTWRQDLAVGTDFSIGVEFEKSRSGVGAGFKFGRYTLEIGNSKIEDVLFFVDAVGTTRFSEYTADRLTFEFSYIYRMSHWLGVNLSIMGWNTTNPDLALNMELSDKARIMKLGIRNTFGFLSFGIDYKYGFKESSLQIEEIKSLEKIYYSAYELTLTVLF
jgi:hypothetical protein